MPEEIDVRKCICDEMIERGKYKSISFSCDRHGKVTVDDRAQHITQTDPVAQYTVSKMIAADSERKRKEPLRPRFRY